MLYIIAPHQHIFSDFEYDENDCAVVKQKGEACLELQSRTCDQGQLNVTGGHGVLSKEGVVDCPVRVYLD